MGSVHDFRDSLEFSHAAGEEPFWESLYGQWFPTMQAMHSHDQNGDHQKAGIDRTIILRNSKQITIDEKVRRKDYGDILLEFWSNKEKRIAGWVAKDLLCDYVAYVIRPAKQGYLLPVPQLRAAWRKHHVEWLKKYERINCKNKNYTTESVAVPPDVVFAAMNSASQGGFE